MDLSGCLDLLYLFQEPWHISTRGGCLRAVFSVVTALIGYALVSHGWDLRWVGGVWLVINIPWWIYILFLEWRSNN